MVQPAYEPALYGFIRSVLQNLSSIQGKGIGSPFQYIDPALKQLMQRLSQFQDLLIDAERRRISREHSVSYWMDDLNRLVYDIDDIVDEINIHWQEVQLGTCQTQAAEGTSEAPSSFINIWYTSDTLNNKITKLLGSLDDLAKVSELTLKLKRDVSHENCKPFQSKFRLDTSPVVDDSEVYGRGEDKEAIIELLLSTGNNSKKNYVVIPIVGMGGIGKTTLAQLVFEDERIKRFFDFSSWVCVSEVFDVAKVTRDIIEYATNDNDSLKHFGLNTSVSSQPSLAVLQITLKKIISKKRLLLVLDDVWTAKEWDKLKGPFNCCATDSKILVTSRFKDVTNAISNRKPYELTVLADEPSWDIFKEKAFGDFNSEIDEELERTGKEITKKCGGVPLAIKVIGGLLHGAEEERWKAVLKNELWHLANDSDDQLFPALKLSYYFLASPLKRCFQYFSIFPTDFVFDKDDLVRMWIGEGFIESQEGRLLENVGIQYYDELKGRSLIQEDDRVHDLIHSLACIMADKIFYKVNNKESHSCKSLANSRFVSLDGENLSNAVNFKLLATFEIPRTMFLLRFTTARPFDDLPAWKSLRVLKLCFVRISVFPRSICSMMHLRYLNISDPLLQHLPKSICSLISLHTLDLSFCLSLKSIPQDIGDFQHLTYLSLSRTQISYLPQSLCNLYNLQVLDLSNCNLLTTLPQQIGNLRGLKRLHLIGTSVSRVPHSILKIKCLQELENSSAELPPSIGKLGNLEHLDSYYVRKRPRHGIEELKSMNRLKGRLVIAGMENIDNIDSAVMADIKKKKHINELGFMWSPSFSCNHSSATLARDGEMEAKIVESLEPHDPAAILSLYFLNYSSKRFPQWMTSFGLHSLTSLNLRGLSHLDKVVNMELPSLKLLIINDCPKLRGASMIVPKLKKLKVFNCKELKATGLVLLSSNLESILSKLEYLTTDYNLLDSFVKQVQAGGGLPIKLEKLVLKGFLINVTSMSIAWLSTLAKVRKLVIKNFLRPKFQILDFNDHLDFIDSLQTIRLRGCLSITGLPVGMNRLSSLTSVYIDNCPTLMSIQREELPNNLSYLCVMNCENLRLLPDGLNNFPSLRCLCAINCFQVEIHPNLQLPPNLHLFFIRRCPRLRRQLTKVYTANWLYIID